jgi:GNAT superfamily N-acetyltransferase
VPDNATEIEVKQLEPGDKVTGLSLGDAAFTALKTFFQKHAKSYEAQSLARTYVAYDRNGSSRPVAFITIVCSEVETTAEHSLLGEDVPFQYRGYPAVKLARLAVDTRYRKSGVGRALVDIALGVVKTSVCPSVGCRFMVVDSKRQSVNFYEKCGFTMLDTDENRRRDEPVMFIDLHKIET